MFIGVLHIYDKALQVYYTDSVENVSLDFYVYSQFSGGAFRCLKSVQMGRGYCLLPRCGGLKEIDLTWELGL